MLATLNKTLALDAKRYELKIVGMDDEIDEKVGLVKAKENHCLEISDLQDQIDEKDKHAKREKEKHDLEMSGLTEQIGRMEKLAKREKDKRDTERSSLKERIKQIRKLAEDAEADFAYDTRKLKLLPANPLATEGKGGRLPRYYRTLPSHSK